MLQRQGPVISTKKQLPPANADSVTSHLDCADQFGRLKRRGDIVWRAILCSVANEQRTSSRKQIHPIFLGINGSLRLRFVRLGLHEFVVSWPERKLVNQIL